MTFNNLAIIDIETTGGSVERNRVIEIGVLLIDNNKITKTWSTFVNPDQRLDPMITQLTGIHSTDLDTAPSFFDIAHTLHELLEGRTFVAHFARFDYSFIKAEFSRVGISFTPNLLCSVKLSKTLFPHLKGHGLDKIIKRYNIICQNRHRAFDDAAVIWSFFQNLQSQFFPEQIDSAIKLISKQAALPTHISTDQIRKLPNTAGVYMFYDERGTPIYVGKSIHIKDRVMSHFYSDVINSKELKIKEAVHHIETITTAGELEALLKESLLIKELQPIYNRKLRQISKLYVVSLEIQSEYLTCVIKPHAEINVNDLDRNIAVFRSKREADNKLKEIAGKYSLCWKLLGLEKCSTGCFQYQLGTCHGACKQKEHPSVYNDRMLQAFASLSIADWPFDGPVAINEFNEFTEQQSIHIIDKWCFIKSVEDIPELSRSFSRTSTQLLFDIDTYKMLHLQYRKHKNQFIPLSTILASY